MKRMWMAASVAVSVAGCSVGNTQPVSQEMTREGVAAASADPSVSKTVVSPRILGSAVPVTLNGTEILGAPRSVWLMHSEDDPASLQKAEMRLTDAGDFLLTVADGSGWSGYDVLQMDGAGHVVYTFRQRPLLAGQKWIWKEARFAAGGEVAGGLRQMLVSEHFLQLKRQYIGGVADGYQQLIQIRANGQTKVIYCSNFYPPEVKELMEKIQTEVVGTHAAEIGEAPVVDLSDAELKKLYDWN